MKNKYSIFIQQTFIKYPLCAGTLLYARNYCCWVAQLYLTLWPHGLQDARLPCPSLSPGVCSNSCPRSLWCHPTISSSVSAFSHCPQISRASGSSPMNESALHIRWPKYWSFSISPSNEYSGMISFRIDWFDLPAVRLSRVFSNTTVQKHQLFSTKPSLGSNSHICTWLVEKPELWLYGPLLAKWFRCFLIYCLGLL